MLALPYLSWQMGGGGGGGGGGSQMHTEHRVQKIDSEWSVLNSVYCGDSARG